MNITEDGKELHILLGNDDSGNIWASIDIQDLKDFLSPNQEKE